MAKTKRPKDPAPMMQEGAPPSLSWNNDPNHKQPRWTREQLDLYERVSPIEANDPMFRLCTQAELKAEGLLTWTQYKRTSPGLRHAYATMDNGKRRLLAARIKRRRPPEGWKEIVGAFQLGLQVRGIDIPDIEADHYLRDFPVEIGLAEVEQKDRLIWGPLEQSPLERLIADIVKGFDSRTAGRRRKKVAQYRSIVEAVKNLTSAWSDGGTKPVKASAVNGVIAVQMRIPERTVERARAYFGV